MATEYKKTDLANVNNRTAVALTTDEQNRANTVITKFFDLFAAEHS